MVSHVGSWKLPTDLSPSTSVGIAEVSTGTLALSLPTRLEDQGLARGRCLARNVERAIPLLILPAIYTPGLSEHVVFLVSPPETFLLKCK